MTATDVVRTASVAALAALIAFGCSGSKAPPEHTIDVVNGQDSFETDDYKMTVQLGPLVQQIDMCARPLTVIGIYYGGTIRIENKGAGTLTLGSYSLELFTADGDRCYAKESRKEVMGDLGDEYVDRLPAFIGPGEELSFQLNMFELAGEIASGCYGGGTSCSYGTRPQKIRLDMKYGDGRTQVLVLLDETSCWQDGDRCMHEWRPETTESGEEPAPEEAETGNEDDAAGADAATAG